MGTVAVEFLCQGVGGVLLGLATGYAAFRGLVRRLFGHELQGRQPTEPRAREPASGELPAGSGR